MRSGSPILNDKNFRVSQTGFGNEVMTESGTYNKVAMLLLICVATASFSYVNYSPIWPLIGLVGGLIACLVTIFKKNLSPITAPIYAALEGLALGAISFIYAEQYPGIVQNAIMLTFAVLGIMFFVYRYEIIKVTDTFRKCVTVSTLAIGMVYLTSMIMRLFGTDIPYIHGSGNIGIGFSLFVVGIASFNLMLNFDFIQNASRSGRFPKYMEWYGAFGLMVTLVWLYIEILKLLAKLNNRR